MGMWVNCPAYYNVSAPKAELLNKLKDMPEEVNEEEEQADVNEKKVRKELGPAFCAPQKDSLGSNGDMAPNSRRGRHLSHHQPCPNHHGAQTCRALGATSSQLSCHFQFYTMTKMKVTGNKLFPKSPIAENKTLAP